MKPITHNEAPKVIQDYFAAVNLHDLDGILANFLDDSYVNDAHREIRGITAISAFYAKEIVDVNLVCTPVSAFEHHGEIIVSSKYDGDFDKTNLPDELILTSYFTLENDKIVSLKIINNRASEYDEIK